MSLPAPTITATPLSSSTISVLGESINGASYYQIEIDGGDPIDITLWFYADRDLDPETTRTYRMRAVALDPSQLPDGIVFGDWSPSVQATTLEGDPAPSSLDPPDNLEAVQTGLDEASVTWDAVDGALGYQVRVNDGDVTDVGQALFFTEDGLTVGQVRSYEVRAYNGAEVSDWAGPEDLTIIGLEPPELTATVLTNSLIQLDWTVVVGAETYDVRVDAGDPIDIGSLLTYLVEDLEPDTVYTFEARGVSGDVDGPWSEPVDARTFPFVLPPVIEGIIRRMAYFPGDRHITARALNAEFNNIIMLLGGTISVDNPPSPPPEPPDPPEPTPPEPVGPTPPPTPTDAEVTVVNTAGTSHEVDLPSVSSGERLYLIFQTGFESSPIDAPSGWSVLRQTRSLSLDRTDGVFVREADGGEGASVTYTTGDNHKSVNIVVRMPGLTGTGQATNEVHETDSFSGLTATIPEATLPGPVSSSHWLARGHWRAGNRGGGSITLPTGWSGPAIASTNASDEETDHTIVVAWRAGGPLTQGGFNLVVTGESLPDGRAKLAAVAPEAGDPPAPSGTFYCRSTQNGPGTGTVSGFGTWQVYDLADAAGSPEVTLTATASDDTPRPRLGWTIELGAGGADIDEIQWGLDLGSVSSTALAVVRFRRVRPGGSSTYLSGIGNSFGPASADSAITQTVGINSVDWQAGDQLRMELELLASTGTSSMQVKVQSTDSFVTLNP